MDASTYKFQTGRSILPASTLKKTGAKMEKIKSTRQTNIRLSVKVRELVVTIAANETKRNMYRKVTIGEVMGRATVAGLPIVYPQYKKQYDTILKERQENNNEM